MVLSRFKISSVLALKFIGANVVNKRPELRVIFVQLHCRNIKRTQVIDERIAKLQFPYKKLYASMTVLTIKIIN